MRLFSLAIFFFLYCNHLCSQTGWTIQNSGTTDALFDVHFFDVNTGIIVGGTATNTAVILRTTNGGTSWDSISPNTNILLRAIDFTTSDLGIAVGGNSTESVILRTTDSGFNWALINNPTTNALRSVSFPPTGTGFIGYAAGFNGTVLKTSDGGNNWNLLSTGIETMMLFSIHFTDVNTGTAVGGSQFDTALIIRTTDAGLNWVRQIPNTTNLLRGVYFINSNTGFAVGNNGTILNTSDGGNNWIVRYNIQGLFLRDIYFTNSNTGFISGSGGKILKTINGGNSWDSIPTETNKDLQAVYFVNDFVGTAVGFDGTIIHTNSGGLNSNNNFSGFVSESYGLSQNYPNPFNPKTIIRYEFLTPHNPPFSKGGNGGFVILKVYDILGNEISDLVNEKQNPGSYEVEFNGEYFSSGIYYYSLYIDARKVDTKRMVLLK